MRSPKLLCFELNNNLMNIQKIEYTTSRFTNKYPFIDNIKVITLPYTNRGINTLSN